jgi:glycosyltransferase involved in cell wall biosynthesis
MNVLVLHSELGVLRGGGENFTRNLFTAFAGRGHQVAAAFVADRHGRFPLPLPSCIEPLPIRGWWSRKLGQATLSTISGRLPSGGRIKASADRLQEALCWRTCEWHDRRFRKRVNHDLSHRWRAFDVVYVHGSAILASQAGRHRPTILRLPGPVTEDLAPVLRAAQVVCANGDALAVLRTFLDDHVVELPIGLDEQTFMPGPTSVRSALGWTEQHRVVGYVGRLTHLKGVDLLATAFRELAHDVDNARLLVIGSGEEEHRMRFVLADECRRGIVHMAGDVSHDQLPSWYRAMDVLVIPSRYENFANVAIEALACGVPVLASDVGGNSMLGELGAGWLFEASSARSLNACLRSVIANRAELKSRGEAGFRSVQHRYSWAASAERLESIIDSHLGVNAS